MTFQEDLTTVIEKHFGKIEELRNGSHRERTDKKSVSEVFDTIHNDLVVIMNCDYTYTLQIVEFPKK